MERVDSGERGRCRGRLPLCPRRLGAQAALLERLVALRCALLRLPYGDQGLLIPGRLYDEVGGYRPLPLMEDVDLVRRLGRRRIAMLALARRHQRGAVPARGLRAPLRPQPVVPDAVFLARARAKVISASTAEALRWHHQISREPRGCVA